MSGRRLALAAGCFVICGCAPGAAAAPSGSPSPGPAVLTVRAASGRLLATFTVSVADTEAARERGLMGVTHLGSTSGMVFAFPSTTTVAFWMKDTLIPLDIAFWDNRGTVITVQRMQPCRADPCPLYQASAPYAGAVEVAGGVLASDGVAAGDTVVLRR